MGDSLLISTQNTARRVALDALRARGSRPDVALGDQSLLHNTTTVQDEKGLRLTLSPKGSTGRRGRDTFRGTCPGYAQIFRRRICAIGRKSVRNFHLTTRRQKSFISYVHGIMDGEVIQDLRDQGREMNETDFKLLKTV
jgi:hypothetical protein